MKIFRGHIVANLTGSKRVVVDVVGTIETIEDYADLLRMSYHLSIADVKLNFEFIGGLKDVN